MRAICRHKRQSAIASYPFRMVQAVTTSLNPAQRRVFELLRRSAGAPGAAPEGLGDALAAELEASLTDVVAHLGGERLNVTKHDLARIHTCERYFLGTNGAFEWTPRRARGSLVHKAIQLAVNWRGEPHPADLVEEALARLVHGDTAMADWLGRITEGVRADLRSEAVDLVSAFLECFPPVEPSWAPVTGPPARVQPSAGLPRPTGRATPPPAGAPATDPPKATTDRS